MDFQILALDVDQFSHLFGLDEEELRKQGVQRYVVDSNPGYPCRVSLQEAEIGDKVLLLNFEHQPMPTPYRSKHAVFVRENARQATPVKNEVPEILRTRMLSVRAFDSSGMLVDADVTDGTDLESLIERLFLNNSADCLHVHNAKPGCYSASVRRC